MAPAGTSVRFEISGEAGGVWFVYKTEEAWTLLLDSTAEAATNVIIPRTWLGVFSRRALIAKMLALWP
jgi:hypothetical protein